ncbi:multidrug efflux protein [Enterovibrio norvegicus FF-162]|uniref:Multidrug export protein MepA n=1 Tax=Enterovibrio norvegicus FF-454 TaxID=1185651 RepID=A0A1E5BW38_9GAMM|nr:MATE family efflux transporter [Enterovibrio norvegicus]OEE57483.1 multidrug efflux protein [Enterovibrio norvegicus FF-454]OEE85056.1 multidrug efflux protein [Enterovibrio norvegicus FF-162]
MHTTDLKQSDSITKTFWRFTIPAIAAMIVNGLYQLVDGIFVGHYIGAEGLAAINIAWPVIAVVGGLGLMVGMGAGSLVSIYRGEGNLHKARSAMATGLVLALGLAIVASVYLYCFSASLIGLQGASGLAHGYASDYLMVFELGALATVVAGALPFLIRNDDSPFVATSMMVVGALTNIVLDYLFIGVMSWGLKGAAFATVLAQLVSVVIGLAYLCSSRSFLGVFRHKVKLSFADAKQSLVLGCSSLVMFMYYGVLVGFHNRLFAEYGTPVSVAAFAVVGYLMTLYYVVAEGIAEGMQPQVSFYHGEKSYAKIANVAKLASLVSLVAGLAWLAVLNVFPDVVIGMFSSGNEALLQQATLGIRLHLSAMYLDGLIILASMYFLSVGKGGKALGISVANMLVQFPFLYVLPKFYGVEGVWLAMPISNIVLASIVLPVMWNDIYRQKRKQFALTHAIA